MRSSHRTWRGWAATGAFLLVAACSESPVELPAPTTMQVFPAQLAMYVGDQATVNAQVFDQNGNVLTSAQLFWESSDRTVAPVAFSYAFAGYSATVTATAAGSARIIATSGSLSDTIDVTVSGEQRSFIVRSLNIIPDSVTTDVNSPVSKYPVVEYRAVDGNGVDRCTGAPALVFRSNTSVATGSNLGSCQIRINPIGAGTTYLVVSIGDAKDSLRVNVSNTLYMMSFSKIPNDTLMRAGDTVSYEVQVLDEVGNGVASQVVSFDANGGSVSAKTATTNASGKATVAWYLPKFPVAAGGTNFGLTASAEFPSGATSFVTNNKNVVPNKTASFVFSSNTNVTDTIAADTTPVGFFGAAYVLGYDKFGNARNTNATISQTNPDVADIHLFDSGNDQLIRPTGILPGSTIAIVTEQGFSDTLPIVIVRGPNIVMRSATDEIRTGQIMTAWFDTTVYNGAKPTHSPVWTTMRDTVAFMLQPLSGGWAPFAAAANGSQAAAPVSLVGADTASIAASYNAGFPVFKSRSTTMGDVIFISDSAGAKPSNIYIVNRSNGAVTKVTANNNPYVRYRGMSLKPDETKVLVATFPLVDVTPANGDSSVASNVYEVDLTTGAATQITQNTDTRYATGIQYYYAGYSPDGSAIYIDHVTTNNGRHLLAYQGGLFTEFDAAGTARYQPTFNPGSSAIIAYLDGTTVYFRQVTDPQTAEQPTARTTISYFSWSKR